MSFAPPRPRTPASPGRSHERPPPRWRSLVSRLSGAVLRWSTIGIAFVLSAELFMRVDDALTWNAPVLGAYTNDRLLMQDSLGFRGRPGYRYQKWRMNNAGFRGRDLTQAPPPGTVRVAISGASETFGLYETEDREYPARVQELLDSVAPQRFEVINAALPGMTLLSMRPYFLREVLPLEPRILAIYLSPSFYLTVEPPALEYTPPRLNAPRMRQAGPWTIEADLFQWRLAAKSREALKQLIPHVMVAAIREQQLKRTRAAYPADWVWPEVPRERMEALRAHLEQLVTSVQAAGVEVLLVTHTSRFVGAAKDSLGPARRHLVNLTSLYYPRASPEVLVSVDAAANRVVREIAHKHGARVVEAEGRIPSTSEYFADYAHFTDAGADLMARIVADGILDLNGDSLRHSAVTKAGGR